MDLSVIRNTLYDRAEQRWINSFKVAIVAQLIAVISSIVKQSVLLDIATFATVFTPIIVNILRESANDFTNKGDLCRRRILYAEAYNRKIPEDELRIIQGWLLGKEKDPIEYDGSYYESKIAPGVQRLADMVAESAYFTCCLAEKIKEKLNLIFGASIVFLIIILYLTFFSSLNPTKESVEIIKPIIFMLITSDIYFLSKRYNTLTINAEKTFQICTKLKSDPIVLAENVHQIVEDYNNILIQSPPILTCFYFKYRDEINETYQKGQGC